MRTRSLALPAVLLLLAAAAAAQCVNTKPAAKPETPPIPKPSAVIQKLARMLNGKWNTSESFEPSPFTPKGGSGKGTGVFANGPGDFSVVSDYHSRSVLGAFDGHGVTYWDEKEKAYKTFWTDSMSPEGATSTGKWEGNDLVFTSSYEFQGQKMSSREVYSDIKPDSFSFHIYNSIEGGPMTHVMTISYKRMASSKKAAAAK
jgi:hypothetical protein